MNLLITQLHEGENVFRYESNRDTWLGEVMNHVQKEGYQFKSPLLVDLNLTKLEPDYYLKGLMKFSVEQNCARCAEPFPLAVTHPFEIALAHVSTKEAQTPELAEESEELDVIYFDGPDIKLNPILEEQFFLSIPFKPLCNADCKGICQSCGKNLNEAPCECKRSNAFSPFAVLENFGSR